MSNLGDLVSEACARYRARAALVDGEESLSYDALLTCADGIDEATAGDLLRRDVEIAERAVLRLIRVPIDDGRFDALGSFTFNLGAGALQRSTLRRKVNREEHDAVPDEFRRWVWAGGRKLKGLIRRREAEAELYASQPVGRRPDRTQISSRSSRHRLTS